MYLKPDHLPSVKMGENNATLGTNPGFLVLSESAAMISSFVVQSSKF